MPVDNIVDSFEDFNFDDGNDIWGDSFETEYKIEFSNFIDSNPDMVFNFFAKHPKLHALKEKHIVSIDLDKSTPNKGVITVNNEVTFAIVLAADKKRFRKNEIRFISLEDPDVTERIKSSVVIPDATEGQSPFVDESAANESILTEKTPKLPPKDDKKKIPLIKNRCGFASPQRQADKRQPRNGGDRRGNQQAQPVQRSHHSSAQGRVSYHSKGNYHNQNADVRRDRPTNTRRNDSQNFRRESAPAKPKTEPHKKRVSLDFKTLKLNKRADPARPSIFGAGKPREEKSPAENEPTMEKLKKGFAEWKPKRKGLKSGNKFGHLSVD